MSGRRRAAALGPIELRRPLLLRLRSCLFLGWFGHPEQRTERFRVRPATVLICLAKIVTLVNSPARAKIPIMRKVIHGCCRLCKTPGPLVDSHIIPNFQYKPMKEKDGYFLVLSTDPAKKQIKRQKGITEYLLCAECDNVRLSRYEAHLAKVLFGGHPLHGRDTGRLHVVSGYDYKKVKNGLLSILWRMSVAKDPYFADVDLGPKHEKRIADVILNDKTLPEEEYPLLLAAPFLDGAVLGDWFLPPDFARVHGNRVYRCLIAGLLFTFIIGSAPLDTSYKAVILRQNQWPIIIAKVEEIPFMLDACLRLGRANAIRDGKLAA